MPEPTSNAEKLSSLGQLSALIYPLEDFYKRSGVSLPPLQQVDGEEVPEPYKRLLVHSSDMTSTLERFYGQTVQINVLGRRQDGDYYFREVVLCTESESRPVEFGAIRINLARFPKATQEQILAEHWPLGRILKDCSLTYSSWPKAFLKLASDRLINSALNLKGAHVLYGRCNTLFDSENTVLADIVEILPPAESD